MHGFLNLDKPAGLTSHDVVARVRRLAGKGVKVGHAGTLDPAATGVLPLALGYATRLIEYLGEARKGYQATIALGITTTTDDAEGEQLTSRPAPPLNMAAIEVMLEQFRGPIMQVPPLYSALHHEGRRLYALARAGKAVTLEARPVTIDRLALVHYDQARAELQLTVDCSKGTYIRALARDIGAVVGCGAHLAALRRTFVGAFTIEESLPLARLEAAPALIGQALLPPELAVADWPAVTLDEPALHRLRNGQPLQLPELSGPRARAHDPQGRLVGLLRYEAGSWQPGKVFAGQEHHAD